MKFETLYEAFKYINGVTKFKAVSKGRKYDAISLAAVNLKENKVELLNGQKLSIDDLVIKVLRHEIFLSNPSALSRYNFKRVEQYFPMKR